MWNSLPRRLSDALRFSAHPMPLKATFQVFSGIDERKMMLILIANIQPRGALIKEGAGIP